MRNEIKYGVAMGLLAAGAAGILADATDNESGCRPGQKTKWRERDTIALCQGDDFFNVTERYSGFSRSFEGKSTGVIKVGEYLVVGNRLEDDTCKTTFIKDGEIVLETEIIEKPAQIFGVEGTTIKFAIQYRDGRILKSLDLETGEVRKLGIQLTSERPSNTCS